jgi:hypothetical protein
MHTSTVRVISELWNSGGALPQTLQVQQWGNMRRHDGEAFTAFCCFGETKLLREGGVYLLPLHNFRDERGEQWSISGDRDVLFEVDENGLIRSNSFSPGFNQFDGGEPSAVADAIADLTADDDFIVAVSRFGWFAHSSVLAEITVTSVTERRGGGGDVWLDYVLNADILSVGANSRYGYSPVSGRMTSSSSVRLERGGRYLVILQRFSEYQPNPPIMGERVARINDDGTITPIYCEIWGEWSEFDEFDGYTVEQLTEFAVRADAWHSGRSA